jgi:hypothetical protein
MTAKGYTLILTCHTGTTSTVIVITDMFPLTPFIAMIVSALMNGTILMMKGTITGDIADIMTEIATDSITGATIEETCGSLIVIIVSPKK